MIKIWTFFFQVLLLAHLLQVSTGLKLFYFFFKLSVWQFHTLRFCILKLLSNEIWIFSEAVPLQGVSEGNGFHRNLCEIFSVRQCKLKVWNVTRCRCKMVEDARSVNTGRFRNNNQFVGSWYWRRHLHSSEWKLEASWWTIVSRILWRSWCLGH